MTNNKKLIEVALPLEAINNASILEKQPFTRKHPRSMHIWWARRPLAAARAVIFAQMVDDPSAHPDIFPTEKAQEKERQRLFRIIDDLVLWENTTNETVLQQARDEIWQSWRYTCAVNADHPRSKELFNRYKLPAFHDPFAGGGALPLEAQRLGLESYASDLNPVAVMINKAIIEIPHKFSGNPPVNPEARKEPRLLAQSWHGVQGLANDVRHYGQWMTNEAEKLIGHLYPKVEVTAEMTKDRPDLKKYIGQKLAVIAWLWARTVKSPNPAFSHVEVPLATTFILSAKIGKEAYIEPVITENGFHFTVKVGKPKDISKSKNGTKSGGSHSTFLCLMSGTPMPFEYLRAEAKAGRMGTRLMAIVASGERQRVYLPPTKEMEALALQAQPEWKPDCEMPQKHRNFQPPVYGMNNLGDIFTPRQLVALTTYSDLVQEVHNLVQSDAQRAGLHDDRIKLSNGGNGATAYADAIAVYLGLATSRWSDLSNSICSWNSTNENVRALFSRQAIPMTWDFVELSPFSKVGSWFSVVESSVESTASLAPQPYGSAIQADAATQVVSLGKVISTDPPYFDNIAYADLSDFFYVWLRHSLKSIFPDLFVTLTVPKAEELVASPNRHGSKKKAETFFLKGMTEAMHRLADQAHPAFPVTIYYAFKQSETDNNGEGGITNTGWDTFLEAVIQSGFAITGTWPIRTERGARSIGIGANALASSIVIVCRKRSVESPIVTRRDFIGALKKELPTALTQLQVGNIAPVDLAQAAIGPGMAVYTRYAKVLDAIGQPLTVRQALVLINQTLDEALAEQEGDFDSDTRWALSWFEQVGFNEGEYGVAETLSKAKDTSVVGMFEAGILTFGRGKVRLLKPIELSKDWDPNTDNRLTTWEMVHQLVRALESGGEGSAAELMSQLGTRSETARELCYRLFTICERKKRTVEALSYNALVQSWPEITRLSREINQRRPTQPSLFQ